MQASYQVPMKNEKQMKRMRPDFSEYSKGKKRKPDYSEQRKNKRGENE